MGHPLGQAVALLPEEGRHQQQSRGCQPRQGRPQDRSPSLSTLLRSRFLRNGLQQSFTRTPRRRRSRRRKCEQSHIPSQPLQLAAAGRALCQVPLERDTFVTLQRSERQQCEIVGELFVQAHVSNTLRSACNPVRIRVLIVPSGSPVLAAISVWVSPSK